MSHFFVSYNTKDSAWAEWIGYEVERSKHHTVTLQAWDFQPGSNFILEMNRGLEEADRVIAVFSPNFFSSSFTAPEWASAFVQDPLGEKGLLLPVRVTKCIIPPMLKPIIYIDLVGLEEQEAREALIKGIEHERAKPESAPSFPGIGTALSNNDQTVRPPFPRDEPAHWSVPQLQNPHFVGRDQQLKRLGADRNTHQSVPDIQILHGLGGTGKTQIAIEHAYRQRSEYDIVWLVRAEELATLVPDLAALGESLRLGSESQSNPSILAAEARRYLETANQHWLLIGDSAEEPKQITDFFPHRGNGHIIITSRNPNWQSVGEVIAVGTLDKQSAVELLLRSSGQSDDGAAHEIAEHLGYLPLALAQAAAYTSEAGISLGRYQALLAEHAVRLLDRGRGSSHYPFTVATTWNVSTERIAKESPIASYIAKLFAFMGPDRIPLHILAPGLRIIPSELLPKDLASQLADPLTQTDSLGALRRYSIAEITDDSFVSLHHLVQSVIRDNMGDDEGKQWSEVAVRLLLGAFSADVEDSKWWPIVASLLQHAVAASNYGQSTDVPPNLVVGLWNRIGIALRSWGMFTQAREAFDEALALAQSALDPSHFLLGATQSNIGLNLMSEGDFKGATEWFKRALATIRSQSGIDHRMEATILTNLGSASQNLADYAGALRHYREALTIAQTAYGRDHVRTLGTESNLAAVLSDMGHYSDAVKRFRRLLTALRSNSENNSLQLGAMLNNFGNALHGEGKLEEARRSLEESVNYAEGGPLPNHPLLMKRLDNLGAVHMDMGELPRARSCLERAIAIGRSQMGPNRQEWVSVLNNYAKLLFLEDDLTLSLLYLRRALRITESNYGSHHPTLVRSLQGMAGVLWKQGRALESRQCLTRAVAICLQAYGPESRQTERLVQELVAKQDAVFHLYNASLLLPFRQYAAPINPNSKDALWLEIRSR